MEFQALSVGIPDRRVICYLLSEECSIPFKHLCREHVPVDDMWALKGFFLFPHEFLAMLLPTLKIPESSSCFEPCLRPNQTWETARFREVERQGLTQVSFLGSSAEKDVDSGDSSQEVCGSG